MVKKKIKRKSPRKFLRKKNPRRVRSSNVSGSMSKKEFKTFEFGVQRLKELGDELNSLDTRGFSREAQVIKSKLKTVSEIPNIERLMKNLKLKIDRKYRPRKKVNTSKKIADNLENIQKEIKSLKKSKNSKAIIDSGVDSLVDTNFNDFLSSVKKNLSNRIKTKEDEMDDILKKDLENRESKYKKKNNNLLKDFQRHKKKLEDFYQRKYKKKVESSLHKEVSEEFNKKLKEKLQKEKVELGKSYKVKLREHAETELQNRKVNLEKELRRQFLVKLKFLQQKFHRKIFNENKKEEDELKTIEEKKNKVEEARQKFELQKQAEMAKIKERISENLHKQLIREMSKREKILRDKFSQVYELKLKRQVHKHEQELKQKKIDLELEMQKKIKQLLN